MVSKKSMEINPENDIISELKRKTDKDASDNIAKNLIWLLYETSLLTSGFSLDDPSSFATRVYKMIKLGLSDGRSDSEADDAPSLIV
jgi:molecular chaperone HtpG